MTLYIEDKVDIYVTVHADAVFWFFTNMLGLIVVGTKYTYGQNTDMTALLDNPEGVCSATCLKPVRIYRSRSGEGDGRLNCLKQTRTSKCRCDKFMHSNGLGF